MKSLTSILRAIALCGGVSLVGCSNGLRESEPFSVVYPVPKTPHIILAANRSVVKAGDTVEVVATFVNPTTKPIPMPNESIGEDGFDNLDYRLNVEWDGVDGASSSGMKAISTSRSPPSIVYLGPKQSKSFRLRWTFEHQGEGVAKLKYEFGWDGTFPPAELKIRTQ